MLLGKTYYNTKTFECCRRKCSGNKKLKKTYFGHCGKNFLSNSGLWKHKRSRKPKKNSIY